MKLIFTSTGDYITIIQDNTEFVEFWHNSINSDGVNSFVIKDQSHILPIDELTNTLAEVNTVLDKFNINDLTNIDNDWFNQHNLNVLHERWVKLQHHYPTIIQILSKFPDSMLQKFNNINLLIHEIEQTFTCIYENQIRPGIIWQTKNLFGASILKSGMWNVELHYQNLGRSLYDKWINFDNNIFDEDTNNFTHIGGRVIINVGRPYTVSLPNEYVDYCNKHNTLCQ
jgi:hypothetical protein